MKKAVLLSPSMAVTAILMAGCASKPVQTQIFAAQTQGAQIQAAGQPEAPKEESKETKAKADDGEAYGLRTSSNQTQLGIIGRILGLLCKIVEEKPGGRIETTTNFRNELGSQSEQVGMCQTDALEMVAATSGTELGAWVPELQIFGFPFLFKDNEEYHEAIKVTEPEVSKYLEQHGFVAYDGQPMGARDMLIVAPATKLEDMKGPRMRGPNNICISMLGCLGASDTTIGWSKVYTALQTKVMDGVGAFPSMINSVKSQDNAKDLAVTNYCMACTMYLFNKDWYDSLPQDLQQIIIGSVDEAVTYQTHIDGEGNDKTLEKIEAEGVVITEIQNIDRWREARVPMPEEYRVKRDSWNSLIGMILEARE